MLERDRGKFRQMTKLYFECKSPSNRYKKNVCTANV